jgi:hypothetical protein
MRITRFLFLTTLLAVVVHSPISAQENLIKSDFPTGDYDSLLKKKLVPEKMTWGYVFIPSFEPEYSIICVSKNNETLLIYNKPDISIWYDIQEQMWVEEGNIRKLSGVKLDESKIHAKISSDTLVISKSLAASLNRLMRQVIDDAKTKETSSTTGDGGLYVTGEILHLDGTTYVFLYNGKAAECWSPNKDTYCFKLISLMDSIRKTIINNDAGQIKVGELLKTQ